MVVFRFYLTTVFIYMIIIFSIIALFKDALKKRLPKCDKKSTWSRTLFTLFILSAVPILRLIIAVCLVYIATCKQEDFDELMKKANE